MSHIQAFQEAIQAAGLKFAEAVIADGKLHRVDVDGDRRGSQNGWYILHCDGLPAGSFGSWKTGLSETWCAKPDKQLSQDEREANRRRFEAARQDREAEEAKIKTEAQERAAVIWNEAKSAASHSYLTRKGIGAHGVRLHDGRLVIPLRAEGELHSLQFIGGDGEKRFLTGGRVSGCYFSIGNPTGAAALCVTEGYATGASIHEATGYPVAVAFNAGNLLAVAQAMYAKFPELALILCADDDSKTEGNPGLTKAREAAQAIGGKLAIPDFGDDRKEGQTDFNDLHQAHGLEAVKRCISGAIESPEAAAAFQAIQAASGEEMKKGSMARELVEFVTSKSELFHSHENQAFVTFSAGDHDETWRVESAGFREWLTAAFFRETGKIPSDSALKDAVRALSGKARYDGRKIPVALRCATVPDGYLIDLCNDKWQAVHVTAQGWQIVQSPEVRFWRNGNMRSLPTPSPHGKIDPLWQFVNLLDSDHDMLLAWMIESYRPDTPFPALELTGGQGAAKSTSQANVKDLIDPNAVNLRARPKTVDDLFVGAINNYLVSFENVSFLTPEMQDALCVLATGGGHASRTLYTNSEETAITIKRPIAINGIAANATAQDFVDRLIHFDLPVIESRKTITELAQGFEAGKAEIFGGILNLFSKALRILPSVRIEKKPRMADFALLGEAVFLALGRKSGDFMLDYEEMRRQSIYRTLDNSPVALAIQSFLEVSPTGFEGTVKAGFETITRYKSESEERWPKTPKSFADSVRRASAALRVIGISVEIGGKTREGIVMSVRKVSNHVHHVHQVHKKSGSAPETVNMVNIVNEKINFCGDAEEVLI